MNSNHNNNDDNKPLPPPPLEEDMPNMTMKRQKTNHPVSFAKKSATEEYVTSTTNHSQHSRLKLLEAFGHLLSPGFLQTDADPTSTPPLSLYDHPYPYGIISSFLLPSFLCQVLEEIKRNSTVQFKESDLFKVYQSIDLANLPSTIPVDEEQCASNDSRTNKMPSVLQLRNLLYSIEFRHFMEDMNQLPRNTLIHNTTTATTTSISRNSSTIDDDSKSQQQQIDCACNCHMTTCHLLCHDDVIGTRKISYILYLTEPDTIWTQSDGGALELYDSYETSLTNTSTDTDTTTTLRIPHTVPCQSILPIFNSMVFFVVQPGYSYHSVQEVFGPRPRLSIQGWYHTDAATTTTTNASDITNVGTTTTNQYSTLQRLKTYHHNNLLATKEEDTEGPFVPIVHPTPTEETGSVLLLSESDRSILLPFICDTYLTEDAIRSIRKRFVKDSSIQLRNFIRDTHVQPMNAIIRTEGSPMIDGLWNDDNGNSENSISSFYHWGVTDEWKLIGPPHKQRFLEYQSIHPKDVTHASVGDSNSDHSSIGYYLQYIRHHLFQSQAFYNYLSAITHLDSHPIGYRGRIRRFRPGRDYTVAHYGLLTQRSVLDATLCFVKETDDNTVTDKNDKADQSVVHDSDGNTTDPNIPEFSEAIELWQSGECGGFECYIEADDDDEASTAGPADEYNPDDDTELLNVSASNNTLSLVYRDPGTMRFIKYVSAKAPSSRYDIAMEYDFPEVPDDVDDNDEEEEEDFDNDDF